VLNFEGVPDTYLFYGGNTNLGTYYSGFNFGPDVTVLDKFRYGYNSSGYPPHSGAAVIFTDYSKYFDVTFDSLATNVGAWYTTYYTLYMAAYDASNNLLASTSGGNNYGYSSWFDVSDPLGRIKYVKIHDSGDYFTVDDFSVKYGAQPGTPELSTLALLACSGLVGVVSRRRRRP
jgi:hypothetical protein